MVEGPGTTNNGKKARALCGLRLAKDCVGIPAGARLADVLVLGKELFLIFASPAAAPPSVVFASTAEDDDVIDLCSDSDDDAPAATTETETAVRCHFGMSGSLLFDAAKPRSARAVEILRADFEPSAGGRARSLAVFGDGSTGAACRADAASARARVAARAHLDVCSDRFDAARAAARLAEVSGDATIAAALMDQRVSPGTGNIIKIESLHRARVAPDRVVSGLSKGEVAKVIREARGFARAWLAGRRPACLVYDKTACGDCGGPVAMTKGDITANRVHFHCAACCSGAPQPSRKREREADDRSFMRGHSCGKPSEKLKRVRKQNCNEGRLFWSCARAGCHANFSWADATFPKCRCDAVSRLRVTKNGNNAGKWFFACSKARDAACGFFQWADAVVLETALGGHLRPLT